MRPEVKGVLLADDRFPREELSYSLVQVLQPNLVVRDLMQSEEPVTLYLVTEPVDKQRLQPLVRVLVNMIVRLSATGLSFEGGMPKPNYRHRLLLMLDEFPSLGKLDILQESLAFCLGTASKLI